MTSNIFNHLSGRNRATFRGPQSLNPLGSLGGSSAVTGDLGSGSQLSLNDQNRMLVDTIIRFRKDDINFTRQYFRNHPQLQRLIDMVDAIDTFDNGFITNDEVLNAINLLDQGGFANIDDEVVLYAISKNNDLPNEVEEIDFQQFYDDLNTSEGDGITATELVNYVRVNVPLSDKLTGILEGLDNYDDIMVAAFSEFTSDDQIVEKLLDLRSKGDLGDYIDFFPDPDKASYVLDSIDLFDVFNPQGHISEEEFIFGLYDLKHVDPANVDDDRAQNQVDNEEFLNYINSLDPIYQSIFDAVNPFVLEADQATDSVQVDVSDVTIDQNKALKNILDFKSETLNIPESAGLGLEEILRVTNADPLIQNGLLNYIDFTTKDYTMAEAVNLKLAELRGEFDQLLAVADADLSPDDVIAKTRLRGLIDAYDAAHPGLDAHIATIDNGIAGSGGDNVLTNDDVIKAIFLRRRLSPIAGESPEADFAIALQAIPDDTFDSIIGTNPGRDIFETVVTYIDSNTFGAGNGHTSRLELTTGIINARLEGNYDEDLFIEVAEAMNVGSRDTVFQMMDVFNPSGDGVVGDRDFANVLLAADLGEPFVTQEFLNEIAGLVPSGSLLQEMFNTLRVGGNDGINAQELIEKLDETVSPGGTFDIDRFNMLFSVMDLWFPDAQSVLANYSAIETDGVTGLGFNETVTALEQIRDGELEVDDPGLFILTLSANPSFNRQLSDDYRVGNFMVDFVSNHEDENRQLVDLTRLFSQYQVANPDFRTDSAEAEHIANIRTLVADNTLVNGVMKAIQVLDSDNDGNLTAAELNEHLFRRNSGVGDIISGADPFLEDYNYDGEPGLSNLDSKIFNAAIGILHFGESQYETIVTELDNANNMAFADDIAEAREILENDEGEITSDTLIKALLQRKRALPAGTDILQPGDIFGLGNVTDEAFEALGAENANFDEYKNIVDSIDINNNGFTNLEELMDSIYSAIEADDYNDTLYREVATALNINGEVSARLFDALDVLDPERDNEVSNQDIANLLAFAGSGELGISVTNPHIETILNKYDGGPELLDIYRGLSAGGRVSAASLVGTIDNVVRPGGVFDLDKFNTLMEVIDTFVPNARDILNSADAINTDANAEISLAEAVTAIEQLRDGTLTDLTPAELLLALPANATYGTQLSDGYRVGDFISAFVNHEGNGSAQLVDLAELIVQYRVADENYQSAAAYADAKSLVGNNALVEAVERAVAVLDPDRDGAISAADLNEHVFRRDGAFAADFAGNYDFDIDSDVDVDDVNIFNAVAGVLRNNATEVSDALTETELEAARAILNYDNSDDAVTSAELINALLQKERLPSAMTIAGLAGISDFAFEAVAQENPNYENFARIVSEIDINKNGHTNIEELLDAALLARTNGIYDDAGYREVAEALGINGEGYRGIFAALDLMDADQDGEISTNDFAKALAGVGSGEVQFSLSNAHVDMIASKVAGGPELLGLYRDLAVGGRVSVSSIVQNLDSVVRPGGVFDSDKYDYVMSVVDDFVPGAITVINDYLNIDEDGMHGLSIEEVYNVLASGTIPEGLTVDDVRAALEVNSTYALNLTDDYSMSDFFENYTSNIGDSQAQLADIAEMVSNVRQFNSGYQSQAFYTDLKALVTGLDPVNAPLVDRIESALATLDADNDGEMTAAELAQHIFNRDGILAEEFVADYDFDADGTVDEVDKAVFDQVANTLGQPSLSPVALAAKIQETHLALARDIVDTSNDGFVSESEVIQSILARRFDWPSENDLTKLSQSLFDEVGNAYVAYPAWVDAISYIDADEDGTVNSLDFIDALIDSRIDENYDEAIFEQVGDVLVGPDLTEVQRLIELVNLADPDQNGEILESDLIAMLTDIDANEGILSRLAVIQQIALRHPDGAAIVAGFSSSS